MQECPICGHQMTGFNMLVFCPKEDEHNQIAAADTDKAFYIRFRPDMLPHRGQCTVVKGRFLVQGLKRARRGCLPAIQIWKITSEIADGWLQYNMNRDHWCTKSTLIGVDVEYVQTGV